ncbi:MAG: aminotransferase class V-fold PLP-dependent enzyme [Puia sp.]|nr:aminotransferase class V-fold PLP-dependent enzyme [Puia sp.]
MDTATFSEQEIEQLRAGTRGTAVRVHFNNAGTSLPPDVVVDTMIRYLQEEASYGGYETEARYKEQLENTYTLIGRLINAGRDEVAITENASIAWAMALYGIDFKEGDVILTSEYEYVTNLLGFLNVQKTSGVRVTVIPNDEYGNFSLQALEEAISPQTRLIAVTQIPSGGGGVIPVVEIGKIARKNNILYLVDASQSIGQIPVDVQAIGCDMLSVNGRKFLRAPRGTGFLYVRKEIQDKLRVLFMDGFTAQLTSRDEYQIRNDGRRFELYEKNRALNLGLGQAIEYALNIGLDRIWQRVQQLSGSMRRQLSAIGGVNVHDSGDVQCGIVTFSIEGIDSYTVKERLAEKQINVSIAAASSTPIYMNKHHLTSVVRASIHYYNTEDEIKLLCDALASMI